MGKYNKHKLISLSDITLNNEFPEFSNMKKNVAPEIATLKIISIYIIFGSLWILLSDKLLDFLVKDPGINKKMELYKGWFYVFITGFIFFWIIYRALALYKKALDYVLLGYEELNTTYEELIAMNETLDNQMHQLEIQKNALLISEQRYELVVEGSYDGIWEWNLTNDLYFLSEKWKKDFGYEVNEIGNTISDWQKLFYPGDWDLTKCAVEKYIAQAEGIYECTFRLRRKSGEYRWILSRGKGVWDEAGHALRISGSHTDITEKKSLNEKLESLAYYDTLTGIPNRILFERKANDLLENNKKVAIINLDIDDFKHINDMYGQDAGDKYLKYIANILSSTIHTPNIAAHLSGDQFAIAYVIHECHEEAIKELELLLNQIRKPWEINEDELFITLSLGISLFPDHGNDFATLLQNSEIAMYCQKETGKDGYTIFQPVMLENTLKISLMNKQLGIAIENDEFVLNYQPQYDLNSGDIVAVESLIRWIHPKNGLISPIDFIPFSETTGHIIPISIWVLKTAIMQKREWERKGFKPLKVAVNMSGHVISDATSIDTICKILEAIEIQPGEIEIEVTETAIMLDLENVKNSLQRLRAYGITIALDDFGTGYSSLTYLHTLPFDILKMDREFIKSIQTEDEESYIYKTVIDLAHNMDLVIVAEGIETKEQRDFLLKNNCDIGQGYYFSKPLSASDIEKILQ